MRILPTVVVIVTLTCASGCACRGNGDRPGETANWTPKAPPSTRSISTSGRPSDPIRIESARYGRDEVWEDVTPQVRRLIDGDTIVFPRDLHAAFNIDPIPGRMKYVEMVIIVDGRIMEITLGDSLHVTPLRLRAAGGGARHN